MNELGTIFGGIEFQVDLLAGGTEMVTIRQLTLRQLPKLKAAMTDEAAQIELYCGRPSGWADSLTMASCEAVIKKAEDLNRDFFSRWEARQKAREAFVPRQDMSQAVEMLDILSRSNPQLLAEIMDKASNGGLPKPASGPA